MTENHPITPSPELLKQWVHEFYGGVPISPGEASVHIATQAARWGADMELEACIAWMMQMGYWGEDGKAVPALRAARRPKPPSLKELALETVQRLSKDGFPCNYQDDADWDTIRRALEALPE